MSTGLDAAAQRNQYAHWTNSNKMVVVIIERII